MGVEENTVSRQGEERPEQQHRPGSNRGQHARHPSGSPSKRVLSWGQHTNKGILGAGALAMAVTAIIALVLSLIPKHSDQNTAHFNSIRPLRVESVDDYLLRSTAGEHVTVQSGGPEGIIDRSCTKVNGQPASLRACVKDISGLAVKLNESASTPAIAEGNSSAKIEPLGELISVDMEIKGLQGQSVILSWSIFPQNRTRHLPREWLRDYDSYLLAPTTNDDTGSLDMWIPLPRQPGPYYVHLAMTVNGVGLASSESGPFD